MLHIKTKLKDLKSKNRVYYMKEVQDIEKLEIYNLSETFKQHIKNAFQEEKSSLLEYFVENQSFERLYILISKENTHKQEILFLGKYFSKLPESFTLMLSDSENIKILIETALLSRYTFQEYKSEKKKDSIEIFIESSQKKMLEDSFERVKNIILARDL